MNIDLPAIQAAAKHLIEVKAANTGRPEGFEELFNAIRAYREVTGPEVVLVLCSIAAQAHGDGVVWMEEEKNDQHSA